MTESGSNALSARDDPNMFRLTATRVVALLLFVVVVLMTGAWLARKPIADETIRRSLRAQGVDATYIVKSIGVRWERIEDLRIGPARSPDLTAQWARIRVTPGLAGIALREVRAGGVRIRGKLVDGRLTLGQIDKLLPATDGKTRFRLPDIAIDLTDTRLRLASPWGHIGARIDGRGNLADGFAGKVAAIAPGLTFSGCSAVRPTIYVDVRIRNREPSVRGPVRADALRCNGVRIAKPALALETTFSAALDRWRGAAAVKAKGADARALTLTDVGGRISFDGSVANTRARGDLTAAGARAGATRMAGVSLAGEMASAGGGSAHGKLRVERLHFDRDRWRFVDHMVQAMTSTPIGPLIADLAPALHGAADSIAIVADARYAAGTIMISNGTGTSSSGAVLKMSGGQGLRFGASGFSVDAHLALAGGGLPNAQATLQRRPDGVTVGLVRVDPVVASGARLALAPLRFAANRAGAVRVETTARLDGPLGDGRITALRLPVNFTVAANGNALVNTGCTPLSFHNFAISGLVLNPAILRLCPASQTALFRIVAGRLLGGATLSASRLSGRLGGMPLTLTASRANLVIETNGVAIQKLSARIGDGVRLSRLDIAGISGRFVNGGIAGGFTGASGKIGAVPLAIDGGHGPWSWRQGVLDLGGELILSDTVVPARFNPLTSRDTRLKIAAGRVAATATLRAPGSEAEVVRTTITHDLRTGIGNAALDVAGLRFGKALQPEQLTRLTLGVIANVEGDVAGHGDVRWTPAGVTSTGRFSTEALNFAAAFGPVNGLKGAVYFDDLLALATPPGQAVTVASINPGTLVTDGVIRYQLLAGQRIAIESGNWPFAGGRLLLDPATIDMAQSSQRRLTFRVVALDAAKFIEKLEFDNLAATGIFDGVLPMIFDATGGKVSQGHLKVRKGGGTIAYVGEVSNARMNVFAKLAFDALKSIRYQNLTIDLDGPLDGEIVSKIRFDGVNEAPLSPPKSFFARQFIGLPFLFNIQVKAPFRGLIATAKTFQDPSSLLQRTVPELRKQSVQPGDSEMKR